MGFVEGAGVRSILEDRWLNAAVETQAPIDKNTSSIEAPGPYLSSWVQPGNRTLKLVPSNGVLQSYNLADERRRGSAFFSTAEVKAFVDKTFPPEQAALIKTQLDEYKAVNFTDFDSTYADRWTENEIVNALRPLAHAGTGKTSALTHNDLAKFDGLDPNKPVILKDLRKVEVIAIDSNQGGYQLPGSLRLPYHGIVIEEWCMKDRGLVVPISAFTKPNERPSVGQPADMSAFNRAYSWLDQVAQARHQNGDRPIVVSISIVPGKMAERSMTDAEAVAFINKTAGADIKSYSAAELHKLTPQQRETLLRAFINRLDPGERAAAIRFLQTFAGLIENPGVRQINIAAGNATGTVHWLPVLFGPDPKVVVVGGQGLDGKIAPDSARYYETLAPGVVMIDREIDGVPRTFLAGERYAPANATVLKQTDTLLGDRRALDYSTDGKGRIDDNQRAFLIGWLGLDSSAAKNIDNTRLQQQVTQALERKYPGDAQSLWLGARINTAIRDHLTQHKVHFDSKAVAGLNTLQFYVERDQSTGTPDPAAAGLPTVYAFGLREDSLSFGNYHLHDGRLVIVTHGTSYAAPRAPLVAPGEAAQAADPSTQQFRQQIKMQLDTLSQELQSKQGQSLLPSFAFHRALS